VNARNARRSTPAGKAEEAAGGTKEKKSHLRPQRHSGVNIEAEQDGEMQRYDPTTSMSVSYEKKKKTALFCVRSNQESGKKNKGIERKGRFKSGNREAAHGGRQRPAADRQAGSEEGEGGGEVS